MHILLTSYAMNNFWQDFGKRESDCFL